MELKYNLCKSEEEIRQLYNFNTDAFSGMADLNWSMDDLKSEVKKGWGLYATTCDTTEGEAIVAAFLIKIEGKILFSKNTPIKIDFQGKGLSHIIKEHYEDLAKQKNLNRIIHYCKNDDFRAISLNETHGYALTGKKIGEKDDVLEWAKDLR